MGMRVRDSLKGTKMYNYTGATILFTQNFEFRLLEYFIQGFVLKIVFISVATLKIKIMGTTIDGGEQIKHITPFKLSTKVEIELKIRVGHFFIYCGTVQTKDKQKYIWQVLPVSSRTSTWQFHQKQKLQQSLHT